MRKVKNEHDLRAVRTHQNLLDAYVRLAGRLPRNQINVTSVTEEAHLNRRTFYGHYRKIDDLLVDVEAECAEKTVQTILSIGGGQRFSHISLRSCDVSGY